MVTTAERPNKKFDVGVDFSFGISTREVTMDLPITFNRQ